MISLSIVDKKHLQWDHKRHCQYKSSSYILVKSLPSRHMYSFLDNCSRIHQMWCNEDLPSLHIHLKRAQRKVKNLNLKGNMWVNKYVIHSFNHRMAYSHKRNVGSSGAHHTQELVSFYWYKWCSQGVDIHMELFQLYCSQCIWPWCSCTIRRSHFADVKRKKVFSKKCQKAGLCTSSVIKCDLRIT